LFKRQGEHPGCFKSANSLAPLAFFFSLFIHLTLGVVEQSTVMLEQRSKNRLAMLRNISAA